MATIPSVPRRATQPLPSESDLGGDIPSVGAKGPVQVQGGIAEQGEIQGGTALAQGGQGLQGVADSLAKAKAAIDEQNDAMTRITGMREYRAQAEAEKNRLMLSGALHDPETMKGYGKFLAELEQNTLSRYGGSTPGSKVALSQQVANMGMGYTSSLAQVATQAQADMLKDELVREITPLAVSVTDRPETFLDAIVQYEGIVDQLPGSPAFKAEQKKRGLGVLAESVINKFWLSGDLANVPGALNDVMDVIRHPQVADALGPDKFNQIYMKVMSAQKASLADVKGIPRDIFDRMSPADQRAALLPSQTVVNVTPEQSYATSESKELAKTNVEAVGKDRAAGAAAEQDLTRIQQFRAALDSGQFRTGAAGESRQMVGRWLEFFGAPPALVQAIGDPKQADAMDSAAAWLSINAAEKLSRMTNLSLSLIKDTVPNLTRTVEGNKILLDILERAAQRDIEVANLANVYMDEYGTLRPKGKRSYFQARTDLMKDSPIVDEALRKQIMEASALGEGQKAAEKAAKAVMGVVAPGTKAKAKAKPPKVGEVIDGWRFNGGIPGDQANWEKVQ